MVRYKDELLDIPFSALKNKDLIECLKIDLLEAHKPIVVEGINVSKLINCLEDDFLNDALKYANYIHLDGQPLGWLAKLTKKNAERYAGIDLFIDLCRLAQDLNKSVYLLGATDEVLHKTSDVLKTKFPDLKIVGLRNGYFSKHEEINIIESINASLCNFLFIGMPSPKKELFIYENIDKFQPLISLGVGGSFDVVSGKFKRAPKIIQTIGFEWLYRLSQEPKRLFKRYLITNSKFICLLVRHYYKKVCK